MNPILLVIVLILKFNPHFAIIEILFVPMRSVLISIVRAIIRGSTPSPHQVRLEGSEGLIRHRSFGRLLRSDSRSSGRARTRTKRHRNGREDGPNYSEMCRVWFHGKSEADCRFAVFLTRPLIAIRAPTSAIYTEGSCAARFELILYILTVMKCVFLVTLFHRVHGTRAKVPYQ